jgi:hypothetical protein
MPTPTLTPDTLKVVQPAPALTLDDRLALTGLAMDEHLAVASAAISVNTAHIEIPEILVDPLPAGVPTAALAPATAAEVLAEARRLITAHGWIRRYAGSAATGYCLIGAIRAAAGGNQRLEDAAEGLMLDRIRAEAPDALSIGAWNDAQSGAAPVLRVLG